MRSVLAVLLVALASWLVIAEEEDAPTLVHECASHGFRIARPDDTWTVTETRDASADRVTVTLRPAGNAGTVEASLLAGPAPDGNDAIALRGVARAGIAGKENYSDIADLEEVVAGSAAPGLGVRCIGSDGRAYRIRQFYVVRGDAGTMYVFTVHAPVAEYDAHAAAFDAIRASIALLELPAETLGARRLAALARRCGSEVSWAAGWDEAAARARREGRLVLVVVRAYSAFALSDEIRATTFMDPEVLDLARGHLVCLRLEPGMPAPIRAQDRYGMSATTFGQALLIVDPDGHVVDETCWIHPVAVVDFLRHALGLPPPPPAPPRTDLEKAVLLLRAGRPGDAAPLLAATLADDAQAAAHPEAAYWSGVCAGVRDDLDGARATWQRLCDEHPESRWAWKAAATLTGTAFSMGYAPVPTWPDNAVRATLRRVPEATDATAAEAEQGAIAYLLAHQRADGSWISPSEVNGAGRPAPNAFVDAIAALGGRAMLQRRADPRCASSAARALEFLLASHERARKDPDRIHFMDYRVWSRSLAVWFLADCLDAGVGEADDLRVVLADLVGALFGKQTAGGGWSYFLSTTPEATGAVPRNSTSFVTAAAVLALTRAREAGVAVPGEGYARAVACLERMRGTDGAFEYMRADDAQPGARTVGIAGAAGRGPLCELALLRAGRSDPARVRKALEAFRDHRGLFLHEQGKALMHAGPDGQGCHYLMFDYAFAAAAVAALPPGERTAQREWILDLVRSARSEDGAFQDTLINGRACGTALALLALQDLRAER